MTDVTAFPDWLANRTASTPDRDALVAGEKTWTFGALDRHATITSRRLAALGVREGDRVATLLDNGFAAALLPHATLRLGATLVPLNVRLSDAEIAWQLADAKPRLLVSDGRTLAQIAEALGDNPAVAIVKVDSDEMNMPRIRQLDSVDEIDAPVRHEHPSESVLAIIYTSGTTGQPKGVMLTVGNFWWSAIGSALNLGTTTDDRWLACLPLFHVGGLSILMRSAIYGTTVVVHERFDARAVNAAIDDNRVTMVSVVAVMLQRMLDARSDAPYPRTLRCVLVGGGPVPTSLLERCASVGVPVVQTYGLTEACSQVVTISPDAAGRRHGSAGRVLYPNQIRIGAPSDRDPAPGEEGEILVRGPIVMAGYAGRPDDTSTAIVGGWLHTGDVGRIDADGFLYVLDRRDDLIVTGGENVYPAEVEAALLAHPLVEEACVVGVADDAWGQRIVAIVRMAAASHEAELNGSGLIEHCRTRLAGYKVPREIVFVTAPLPRTASGKLRRARLRDSIVAD